jgi:alpha-tubulin suppressor-like RCC1 family protein
MTFEARTSALLSVLSVLVAACGSPAGDAKTPAEAPASPSSSQSASSSDSSGARAQGGAPETPAAPNAEKSQATLAHLSTAEPACALDAEGRPWHWPNGKLERAPVDVKGAKAISCAPSHTCIVAEDGSAKCWGEGMYGALGDGTQNDSKEAAVAVKGLANVADIVVDLARTCARTISGEVYCWGDREFAKAGDGTLIDGHKGREKPLAGKPVLGLTGAQSLGVSLIHACAATAGGAVMCWGQCRSGACGLPPRPPWIARATKAPKVSGIASLSAGENATCGIDTSGGVSCWGTSDHGILGESISDAKPHDSGAKIALPAPAAEISVSAGGHACARLAKGVVHCWGNNDQGQLGDGTTTERKAPTPVKGLEKATAVAAGQGSTCAIAAGRLYCWGRTYGPAPMAIPQGK